MERGEFSAGSLRARYPRFLVEQVMCIIIYSVVVVGGVPRPSEPKQVMTDATKPGSPELCY